MEREKRDYSDIMGLERPAVVGRARMSRADRAAQFSPFAALTGLDDTLEETGRLTDTMAELDESRKQELDRELQRLEEGIGARPRVRVSYFRPDGRKSGGAYVSFTGRLKEIDQCGRELVFTDRTRIPIDRISGVAPAPEEL